MKGLIKKDFYLIRFQLIGALIGMLLLGYLCFSVASGRNFETATGYVMRIVLPTLIDYVVIVIGSSFFLNTIAEDLRCGWVKLQRAMPVSEKQAVGAKLISTYILIGALVLFSALFNLLFWATYGGTLELVLTIPLCIGLFQVVSLSPVFPLGQRYGVNLAQTLYIVLEILVTIVASIAMFPALSGDISLTALRTAFYVALPLLAAAVGTVSFQWGSKLLSADI